MKLTRPTLLVIVVLAIALTSANSPFSSEKTGQIRQLLTECKSDLDKTLTATSAQEAKLPLDNILQKIESCVSISSGLRKEMTSKREQMVQNENASAVQKYIDLESDFLELETELNRLARKISDAKRDGDQHEFNHRIKNLDNIFSELDKFLNEIEKEISTL